MSKVYDTLHFTQCGWLRRPELDTRDGACWEQPDGSLFYLARYCKPCLYRLRYHD